MKNPHRSSIESILRNSGLVVTNNPSTEHPTAITLSYRNNPDGSVAWLWPKGCKRSQLLQFRGHCTELPGWVAAVGRVCFAVGIGGLVADGKQVLYADATTASYILNKWRAD